VTERLGLTREAGCNKNALTCRMWSTPPLVLHMRENHRQADEVLNYHDDVKKQNEYENDIIF
jgi:hypothetical protein